MSGPVKISGWQGSLGFPGANSRAHTVDVLPPLPRPVMILPMMNCSRVVELACKMAPMIMMEVPNSITRLRPRGLPMKMVIRAPMKQPRLYEATAMPWYVDRVDDSLDVRLGAPGLIMGNVSRKILRVRMPPMTPWSTKLLLASVYHRFVHVSYHSRIVGSRILQWCTRPC